MELYGPTAEQLARDAYEAPERNQFRDQIAYRRKPAYERLPHITPALADTAKFLIRCHQGSMGMDVRLGDEPPAWGPSDEYSIHRWGRELAEARATMPPKHWSALLMGVVLETMSPQSIGHQWGGYKSRAQAKVYGDTLLISGLEILAVHWGYMKPPDR